MRSKWIWLFSLAACSAIAQQNPSYPVMGDANRWNRYEARFVEVFRLDFETPAPAITISSPSVALTNDPAEVISGRFSLKLSGASPTFTIRPEVLNLRPGNTYVVEYRYRVLAAGGQITLSSLFFESTRGPINGESRVSLGGPWMTPNSSRSGIDSRGLRIPDMDGITVGISGLASTFVVDDIRIFRQDTALLPASIRLLDHGFPRLMNYMLTDPANIGLMHDYPVDQIERDLAAVDIVFGVNYDHTIGASAWGKQLLDANPKLRMLPYTQAFMMQYPDNKPVWGSAGLFALFNRTLHPEWFMTDASGKLLPSPDFLFNVQMNHTPYCPKLNGVTWTEHTLNYLQTAVLSTGLWEGFHFDQPEWYPNPLLADKAGNMPPMDSNRDGRNDDQPFLHAAWKDGFTDFFTKVRERFGPHRLLFGNAGYISVNEQMLPFLNGWLREILTPYQILPNGEWKTDDPSGWYHEQRGYRTAMRRVQGPAIVALQYTGSGLGEPTGGVTANGYPARRPRLEPRDFRRMRLGLTSTLLDDGYFEYDLVDNTTVPVWFDEYAVDRNGVAARDSAGRGYLGQPLGDGVEVVTNERVLAFLDFESSPVDQKLVLGPTAAPVSDPARVISGGASMSFTNGNMNQPQFILLSNPDALPLQGGRTYEVTLDYRVLDYKPVTFKGFLALGFNVGNESLQPGRSSFQYLPDVAGPGQRGSLRAVAKIPVGQSAIITAGFLDTGSVAIDNVKVSENGAGVWRRDFENGIVLVNPTPDAIRVTQAQLQGPLNRTRIRRIRGNQAPAWNNGAALTNGIEIPAGDGIVLLADTLPAAPMAAPSNVVTDRSGNSVDVYWRGVNTYVAGYLIRYGEDPIRLPGELAVTRHQASARISGLTPGTRYYVQVAAYDYLGRVGPGSVPMEVSTTGSAPLLPVIRPSAMTPALVAGAWATIDGFGLATDQVQTEAPFPQEAASTRVLVNGIAAPVRSVSPNRITFQVPWQADGSFAFVQASADGRTSAPITMPLQPASPELVPIKDSAAALDVVRAEDGSPVTADAPARPGDRICFRARGLGMVEPPPPAGALPVVQARTTRTPDLLINNILASEISAELAADELGDYLVCGTVPTGTGEGMVPVTLWQGGIPSDTLLMAVQELAIVPGKAGRGKYPTN